MTADLSQHLEFVARIFGSICMALQAEENANVRVGRYRYASERAKSVLHSELNEEWVTLLLFLRHDMPVREGLAIEEIAALHGPNSC